MSSSTPMTAGPEERLGDLQRRFRVVSARLDRTVKLRRWYRLGKIAALAALVSFALCWVLLSLSPWPPMTTLRHIASFRNCSTARAVGLAPARKGQPGYWKRHDADEDGNRLRTIAAPVATLITVSLSRSEMPVQQQFARRHNRRRYIQRSARDYYRNS
jgi:hypothetical protein